MFFQLSRNSQPTLLFSSNPYSHSVHIMQHRTEPKYPPTEADRQKPGKSNRKYDHEQGEPEPWELVLRAVNDLKSEVSCFLKLLIERASGIMHEDIPRRPNQQGSKANGRDTKSKNQRPDKFAGTAAEGKGNDKSGHAPS
jgi:hypothetical protein